MTRTLEVLRRRVDQLGVAELSLQRSGEDRIIVELPGVTNPEEALAVIGRTAQLTFHQVLGIAGVLKGEERGQGTSKGGCSPARGPTGCRYSINDSVVVFDRIREQRRLRVVEPLAAVANAACLQTVPRTINTGLGALSILIALYFLGGETLSDFALALIVGILVGTYSSVFTAAPLAVAFDRLWPAPVPTGATRTSAGEAALLKMRWETATVPAATDMTSARTTSGATKPPRKRAGTSKRKGRRR